MRPRTPLALVLVLVPEKLGLGFLVSDFPHIIFPKHKLISFPFRGTRVNHRHLALGKPLELVPAATLFLLLFVVIVLLHILVLFGSDSQHKIIIGGR